MKERKKWSAIAISIYVLAVVLAVSGRFFLPKPATEVESVVEQYLLLRTALMAGAAGFAFLGLLVMSKKLRCPHCGAMALRKIVICGNCGKDFDAEVVVEEVESAEEAAAIEAPAVESAIEENQEAESAETVSEEK